MNIRLKKNILTDDGVKFESEIIELNDELAQKLVKAGQAETVDKQITEIIILASSMHFVHRCG